MEVIRCSGRQLRQLAEQVTSDEQQIALTQIGDSPKVGFLGADPAASTVLDPAGRATEDAYRR